MGGWGGVGANTSRRVAMIHATKNFSRVPPGFFPIGDGPLYRTFKFIYDHHMCIYCACM